MLIDMMSGKPVNRMPYAADFADWTSRLEADEIADIYSALDAMIDGDEIHTAGWMPGSNWADTPFHPIYEKAARGSYRSAALCFGLFVWDAFNRRPETWTSGRFEKDGEEIGSRTYFRVRARHD